MLLAYTGTNQVWEAVNIDTKGRISLVAVVANLFLMLLKMGVGFLSGSMAMISDGIHSATDLLAALAAWLSVRISAKPADSCHPWGHGKFENLAALGQGVLVLASAGAIAWHSFGRLMNPVPLAVMEWGMLITTISIVTHTAVSWRMFKVARATESPALSGAALHMLTDISSSIAVLIGLVMARFWGILIADAIAALAVTLIIVAGAIKLIISSSRDLVDSSLPAIEQQKIEEIFSEHTPPLKGYHKLGARRVGRFRCIEVHLVVDGSLSVEEAHELCDHLEDHLRERFPNSRPVLHVEPD